ncbi:MAG: sulfatase-like hydrolase/transferase [Gemmatimonadetes bacterium]|nr:sulfatase-like hydrolase/transferase [Gemmatimonadota bacterium]
MTRTDTRYPILIVCIDSLRADAVDGTSRDDFWGDLRPRTPVIDSFIRESIGFPHAYSVSAWTKPTVPSIFTSLYPSEHGVLETAKEKGGAVTSPPMPKEATTLAKALHDLGYRTSGIAKNAQFETIASFDRGFDFFTSNMEASGSLGLFDELGIGSASVPTFTYLHMMEPHWPFSDAVAERLESESSGRFAFHRYTGDDWKGLKKRMRRGETELSPEEFRFLKRAYAAAVEEADSALGQIWEGMRHGRRWDDTLVILTADHGEELNDHGAVGHGQSLYEELTRVPLYLKPPASVDPALLDCLRGASGDVVSLLDLYPTVLGMIGQETSALAVSGIDLTRVSNSGRTVFAEVKHKRRYLEAAITKRFKAIRNTRFKKNPGAGREDYNNLRELLSSRKRSTGFELYDLVSDPAELENLADRNPEMRRTLEASLDDWRSQVRDALAAESGSVDEEIIRRLEKLGYM